MTTEELEDFNIPKSVLIKKCIQLEKQNKELQERNAELKGKYAYSAREAETYKQFCEQKDKQIEELKCNRQAVENARNVLDVEQRKYTKDLKAQIEKMKKYIKACWVEENLNGYSSYITNTSNEFIDLVKELNAEVKNGR